jgi:hypothetical protein
LLVVAAVGVLAALALGDALRSGRSSSAPGTAPTTAPTTPPAPTTDTALPPTSTSTPEVARTPNTCGAFRIAPSGGYPLLVVEVVAGSVTCHDARRVMKSHYVGLDSSSWSCRGREGRSGCEKPSGETVSAHFADALDDPEWDMEQIANRWARAFASAGCSHMSQPSASGSTANASDTSRSETARRSRRHIGGRSRKRGSRRSRSGGAGRGEVLERRADRARWGRRGQVVRSRSRRTSGPQGLRIAAPPANPHSAAADNRPRCWR